MSFTVLSTFDAGDMTLRYTQVGGRVGLQVIPKSMVGEIAAPRETLEDGRTLAYEGDSLIHLAIAGTAAPAGFAQGRTMRNGPATGSVQYVNQSIGSSAGRTVIATRFRSPLGFTCEHLLTYVEGEESLEVQTRFTNMGQLPLNLEMLSSFSLGFLTPFAADDAPGRLRIHRFRSSWSQEGRLDTQTVEQLHLERSWSGGGAYSERFGQVGTMPCRGFFPFIAAEDTVAGVVWGAQLYWAGSWQMEAYRKDDNLCISGGLADRELGHWVKTFASGQTFLTPPARISCVKGTLEELCQRLTRAQEPAANKQPAVEQDLPIIFNEWCTSWGNPTHENVVAIADRLRDTTVKYLVIDAGWYKPSGDVNWANSQGDWTPSPQLFPHGLKAVADDIRARGLVPGLWFEWEVAGPGAAAFKLVDRMLKRDGVPILCGDRHFWNLNDPAAMTYLQERVINLLVECGIGYVKIDYNETIGIGCDGAESLGEGLRRQVEGVYRMLDILHRRLPSLVIENCSSGGHRLEPSMMTRHAMGSFSDAHECVEIPIIAANLHNLVLPRQSQIWAVLKKADDPHRLVYSLAATFLGRMCLSGEIAGLADDQWQVVQQAMALYRDVAQIIKLGRTRKLTPDIPSLRHPEGAQAVLRTSYDQDEAMLVVHSFAKSPRQLDLPIGGGWSVAGHLTAPDVQHEIRGDRALFSLPRDFTACVVRLAKK